MYNFQQKYQQLPSLASSYYKRLSTHADSLLYFCWKQHWLVHSSVISPSARQSAQLTEVPFVSVLICLRLYDLQQKYQQLPALASSHYKRLSTHADSLLHFCWKQLWLVSVIFCYLSICKTERTTDRSAFCQYVLLPHMQVAFQRVSFSLFQCS